MSLAHANANLIHCLSFFLYQNIENLRQTYPDDADAISLLESSCIFVVWSRCVSFSRQRGVQKRRQQLSKTRRKDYQYKLCKFRGVGLCVYLVSSAINIESSSEFLQSLQRFSQPLESINTARKRICSNSVTIVASLTVDRFSIAP